MLSKHELATKSNICTFISEHSDNDMSEEQPDTDKKTFRLLGILDVENVPCARESLLFGAGGALAAGLLHFLVTSRVRRSYDVGFAGFFVTTLGSWFYCRINNAKLRVQERVIQHGLRNKVVYQGTSLDPTQKPPTEPGAETRCPGLLTQPCWSFPGPFRPDMCLFNYESEEQKDFTDDMDSGLCV
ncbi:hypothetical protein WMY93_017972 [Mugilogobius chulae]|uniref:Cytochrome c oxidase assembly protein COX20, mitochondrial n=1 Tax=Mugilogobius chulae TaxID=88201 RepID=A0AAW0NIP5_9GOBI